MEPKQFADQYIISNTDKFNVDQIPTLKSKLDYLPESRQIAILSIPLKNPIVTLILSLCLGCFGVDRFYLGDIGLGILKVIAVTFMIGFIWVIIDWFLTYKRAKTINFEKVMMMA